MNGVLTVAGVSKSYHTGKREVTVLRDLSFSMDAGETVAIVGPSGSGKTTLLCLCAGLEMPSTGTVTLLGRDLAGLDEDERARLRNRDVGFIFQSFHLMPSLTALENVMLPLELLGGKGAATEAKALLDQVGLSDRLAHYPSQLSGGEQQRVAIARAFINKPSILFADEPTGNLDRETSARVTRLLFDLNREKGTTLLLITHDARLAERTQHTFHLDQGALATAPVSTDHASNDWNRVPN